MKRKDFMSENMSSGTEASESTSTEAKVSYGSTEPASAPKVSWKNHAVVAKTLAFLQSLQGYAFEIFLIAFALFIIVGLIVFPRIGLLSLAAITAVSGWIAYFGLRRKGKL